jgi:signal transduction histidine kinase/AmiR/NasT family two-component response regulator
MACMTANLHDRANWEGAAPQNVADLLYRLVCTAIVAGFAQYLAHGPWPAIWLGAIVGVQTISMLVRRGLERRGIGPGERLRRVAVCVDLFVNSAVYALICPLFWSSLGWGARISCLLVLAGGAMNIGLRVKTSPTHMLLSQAPFLLLMALLPLSSVMGGAPAERGTLLIVTICAAAFAAHIAAMGLRNVAAGKAIERAFADAERQRLRAEAASAAKSEFLAVMSHELRTPLNGVLGMSQIMESDVLSPRQRARLEVVRKSGEDLLVLLNDLLDISHIETETLELTEGVVAPRALAAQAESLFGPLASAKSLTLEVRVAEGAGGARIGDGERVRQVLHNLIGNAIKYTDTGGVRVAFDGSPDELVMMVTDTGPGIARERQAAIFERFSEPEAARRRGMGGAGFRLSITRGLARLMGGEISVRSEPGYGSTFTARLPLRVAAACEASCPERAEAADAPIAPTEERVHLRVLAAEDNPTNQLVLRTLLEQLGIVVDVVGNGEEAIAAWRAAAYDLVLMDIQMPVMDGLAATRAIRAEEAAEGRSRTPIIAVTANAATAQAAEYLRAGMNAVVPKPIHFSELLQAISGAMEAENDNQALGRTSVA